MILGIIIGVLLLYVFIKYIFPWIILFLFAKWLVKHKDKADPVSITIGVILGLLAGKLWQRQVNQKST